MTSCFTISSNWLATVFARTVSTRLGQNPPFEGYSGLINRTEVSQNIFLSINVLWHAWYDRYF